MATYRTGIIACGIIARVHARAWLGVEGGPTEIGAIADTNPDALREFGEFFGVPEAHRYADYRQMLDSERLDFVDVCSWHQQHAEMVIAAAARQPKAIICQKPMAVDLGEADAMLTACQRNGVKLTVAYQRPHHTTWKKAKDLIREGAIGRVTQIQLDAGGNLLNTNSHNIRLALFLMDEPQVEWVMGAVERTTDLMERGLPAEDACLGLAACDNGAMILIMGNLVEGLGQGCRVIGTQGIMELSTTCHPDEMIPSDAPMHMPEGLSARYNFEIGAVRYLNGKTGGWDDLSAPWHDCWSQQCREAIDWVEGRTDSPVSGGERGRAVQEVMMALYESARKRQRIYLPLKTRVNPLSLMVESGELEVEWPGSYERRATLVRGEAMSWHET
ncbi:MAG: Gfo/Idh/MocA family oxidoreductase [Caldilineaceae bacterium SB0661_bin_32]|uniref:Gfo/Idh/MocA family oxidoreductase n=1 Tax=Caldilineaceae bacterium SB0661_bin_32 TaxID=2605255 RepID=A0A6B1D1Y7_9CHLR|nr:Gfo/Idh/MocA family oxidoreductase [Caldilineaceae bacterium SB0661_bin_32]